MKKIAQITFTETRTIIVDVICNGCGKSCRPEHAQEGDFHGLIEAQVAGGYYSVRGSGIDDMSQYDFSLCELCLAKAFDGFLIPPTVSGQMRSTSKWIAPEQLSECLAHEAEGKHFAARIEKLRGLEDEFEKLDPAATALSEKEPATDDAFDLISDTISKMTSIGVGSRDFCRWLWQVYGNGNAFPETEKEARRAIQKAVG